MVVGVLGLVGWAWAQDPLPMPGVPTPPARPVPLPVPDPTALPGLPRLPEPAPVGPRPIEDAPFIDFVPARPPEAASAGFAFDYATTWVWRERTDTTDSHWVTIAQRPDSKALIALGDANGAVWMSTDGLVSLREALPGVGRVVVGGDGDTLDFDDVLSNVDVEAVGDNEAFQDPEAVQEAAQIVEQAIDAFRDDQESLEPGDEDVDPDAPRLVWIDDVLFAARNDGLFRSSDHGASFQRVLNEDVRAVVATELGYLAGTADGIRYSGDGVRWFDELDGSEDVGINDLVALAGSQAFAATDAGLYQTDDGFTWRLRTRWDEPMRALAVDPDIRGRVWVGTPRNLVSSDDMGRTFQAPLTSPLVGVSRLRWLGSLHWLAATSSGVWETLNGGLSWVPVVTGLPDEPVTGLSAAQGRILTVVDGTIFELVPSDVAAYSPAEQAAVLQAEARDWIPRGALLDSAMLRPELTRKAGGNPWLAYLLPRVTLYGRYEVTDGVRYDAGIDLEDLLLLQDPGTTRPYERWWRVAVELRWSPPGRKFRSFGGADGAVAGADVGIDLDIGEGPGDSSPTSASYQADLARRVSELHSHRIQLVTERMQAERQPLLQQVFLELAIQEIEGELDVYTDGAVAEWERSQARANPQGVSP